MDAAVVTLDAAMFGFGGVQSAPNFGVQAPDEDWEDFPPNPGTNRRPAVKGRVTGSVTEWKGKYGWLATDTPIIHAEARMKGGKIYFSQEDVLEVISGVGAHVSFYVYADGSGLGALNVVPADSPTTKKKITKPKASIPKPKAKATPGRKRVSEDLLYGKVKSWRGGFGFVTPVSPVDHPLFTGSLFLHSNDVALPEQVKEGKKVSFYLYTDPQGLGAEECSILDDEDGEVMPAAGDSPAAMELETSGLLKAKPKASASAATSGSLLVATPKAKGSMMKATPKAAAAVKAAGDPDLAKKMADNPELARQLSAWMFDPGG